MPPAPLRATSIAVQVRLLDDFSIGHPGRPLWVDSRPTFITAGRFPRDEAGFCRWLEQQPPPLDLPRTLLLPGTLGADGLRSPLLHCLVTPLTDLLQLADILPAVLYHHEQWDGQGDRRGRGDVGIRRS